MPNVCIRPEEWVRKTYSRQAVDTPVVMRIKYIGSQAAAHVTLAATTGDMTFEQGATTAAAAVTTGTNPGTSGVIDISDYSYVSEVVAEINRAADWEAWMVDYRPDNDIEISAGNAIYLSTLADQDCTGENGFAVLCDTSLETAGIFPVGVTLNGPSSSIHNSDRGVLHEILKINASITYGGATGGINVYECDDVAGSSTLITNLPLTSATATEWVNSGVPLHQTKGRRFVFEAVDASGAITAPSIVIGARSYKFAPMVNPRKTFNNY